MRPVQQGFVLIVSALLLVGLILALYSIRRILLLFFVGVGLGIVIAPLFPKLKKNFKVPYGVTAFGLLLLFGAFVLSGVLGMVNLMKEQILPVLSNLPELVEQTQHWLIERLDRFSRLQNLVQNFQFDFEKYIPQISFRIAESIRASGLALVYTLFIVAVALYTATEAERYRRGLQRLAPTSIREQWHHLMDEMTDVLRSWVYAQATVMAGVSLMTALALLWIGMPNWLGYSILAGLLDLVPYVGPILTAAILMIVSLTIDPHMTLWVLGAFFIIQQVENYVLVPWAMKKIRLPPIYLLIFIFVMGHWFGFLGVFVASPILAILRQLFLSSDFQLIQKKTEHQLNTAT